MAAPDKKDVWGEAEGAFKRRRETKERIAEGDMHGGLIELRAELDELAAKTDSVRLIPHIAQAHAMLCGLIEKAGGP